MLDGTSEAESNLKSQEDVDEDTGSSATSSGESEDVLSDEEETVKEIQEAMEQMDAELTDTAVGKSFEKVKYFMIMACTDTIS